MNFRRKAPMPQCSFQIHKGPPFTGNNSTGNITENVKLSSYLDDNNNDTLQELHPSTNRYSSPKSIVDELSNTPTINTVECSTNTRDISPLRRSKASNVAVRRANSFDDTYCHLSSSTDTTTKAPTVIASPIRAGKRKDRIVRCASLPIKIKKNVTFDDKYDKIHEIERITDIPSDVILNLWWSTEDYQTIKREYEAIIYLLDQNITVDEQHDSARGLHNRTEHGAWELFEKQRNARNAVLRQQEIHRKQTLKGSLKSNNSSTSTENHIPVSNKDGTMSIDVVIAKAYMAETLHLRDDALQLAQKDYEIAMSVHVMTTSTIHTSSGTESLEDSISDLSLLTIEKDERITAAVGGKCSSTDDRTIQPLRRTRSDNCFVDSMMINTNAIRQKFAPLRSKSTQPQTQGTLSEHIDKNSDVALFERNVQLSSVFEESMQLISDDDYEEEEEEEGDARSTDTIPKPMNQTDHVATKIRFASKTQKIKRMKVKDIEIDTKKRWYSKAELIDIASDVNNMVEIIEKEGQSMIHCEIVTEKDNDETRRGLEKSTEVGAKKLYDRRRHALNVVLAAQSKHQPSDKSQENKNTIDARTTSIAKAYIAATNEAQQEAIKFGKQDAKEARKYRIKRRSTTPDPNASHNAAADQIRRSSSGRRSQPRGSKDDEEDKSVTSENRERSLSPPTDRKIVSNDDSMRSLLNLTNHTIDDCNDYSLRSILNLDTDSVHSTDTTSTSELNSLDSHSTGGHRLSESHAPNRRFVQATSESFSRHLKMFEAKQQSSTMFGPQHYGKATRTKRKTKPFHNYPYDTSSTRDDSTTNGSEGNDTSDPIQEANLQVSLAPAQELLQKREIFSSTDNMTAVSDVLASSSSLVPSNNSNSDSIVWFKVNSADLKEMTLANGAIVYVLRNAERYNNHPDGGSI